MAVTLKKALGDGGAYTDRVDANNLYEVLKAIVTQVASLRSTVAALQTDLAAIKTAVGATIATADAAGTVDGTWGNGAGEEGPALTGAVSLANTAKARINAVAAVTLTATAPAAMGVVVE